MTEAREHSLMKLGFRFGLFVGLEIAKLPFAGNVGRQPIKRVIWFLTGNRSLDSPMTNDF